MALNDNAIFTAAKGYVYTGTVGQATKPSPAEIAAHTADDGIAATGWNDLGHTDREDLPEFGFEGGEVETKGTWRTAALKEVITEAATDYVIVTLSQFDDEALSLYYGVENSSDVEGEFAVADSATATIERAFLMVIEDGPYKLGFYAPRVSVRREDSIELAVDEFSKMPIRASFLKRSGEPLFTWINEETLGTTAPVIP